MSSFPYDGLPTERFWRSAVARVAPRELDPHAGMTPRFQFDQSTRIASAGSCFAQRLSESLQHYGFDYLVTEQGPSWLSPELKAQYNYGVYPARFGNLYSCPQLWQLMQRSLGEFEPQDQFWEGQTEQGERVYYDPFRPRIQPEGFASREELQADRQQHLAAVRQIWTQSDVFVFTFGLTESWFNRHDGAALPMCPGRQYGEFDPDTYAFRNLSLSENLEAMQQFLNRLKALNPQVKVLLTVSPVPLVATMEERHVLQSTVYSKSQLRVLAEELRQRYDWVDYFASYEIISASANPDYFLDNRRNVSEAGVAHVLKCFYRHFYAGDPTELKAVERPEALPVDEIQPCDQEELAQYLEREFDGL